MKKKLFLLLMTFVSVVPLFVSCSEKDGSERDESINLVGTVWYADNGFQVWRFEFSTATSGVMNYVVVSENIIEVLDFTYSVKGRDGVIYGIDEDEFPNGIPFEISSEEDCITFLNITLSKL